MMRRYCTADHTCSPSHTPPLAICALSAHPASHSASHKDNAGGGTVKNILDAETGEGRETTWPRTKGVEGGDGASEACVRNLAIPASTAPRGRTDVRSFRGHIDRSRLKLAFRCRLYFSPHHARREERWAHKERRFGAHRPGGWSAWCGSSAVSHSCIVVGVHVGGAAPRATLRCRVQLGNGVEGAQLRFVPRDEVGGQGRQHSSTKWIHRLRDRCTLLQRDG